MLSQNPPLIVSQITDQYIRKNFQNLQEYFSTQNQLLNFRFFEIVFSQAQTGYKLAHGFAYVPLDVLVTRLSGTGVVTFEFAKFDTTNIVMDVTGPCRIRFFVGTTPLLTQSATTQVGDRQQLSATPNSVVAFVQLPLTGAQIASNLFPGSSSSNYQVRALLDQVLLVDCTLPQIVTLPPAESMTGRFLWTKKNGGTQTLTIAAQSGELVEGSGTLVLSGTWNAAAFFSAGAAYYRVVTV